jgi:hypothetical protein
MPNHSLSEIDEQVYEFLRTLRYLRIPMRTFSISSFQLYTIDVHKFIVNYHNSLQR